MTKTDVRNLVYTSAELAANHVRLAEKIKAEPGVTWGIPSVDKRVIPMRGGDVSLLIARPGHAKTTLMAYLARVEANRIVARGSQGEETVIYATWEGTVDAIYAAIVAGHGGYSSTDFYWGRTSLDAVKANVVRRGVFPIMMIGFSTISRGTVPLMTLDVLLDAIESVRADFGLQPTLVCLDYLQLIPSSDRGRERQDEVARAIVGAKMLGMKLDVPFVLGAQAGRQVDGYGIKLPTMSDIMWSSQAEQHSDKLFGLWRPALTEALKPGEQAPLVEIDGHQYEANERLLVMRMLKQRGDAGRYTWALHMEPELLKLAELDMVNLGRGY